MNVLKPNNKNISTEKIVEVGLKNDLQPRLKKNKHDINMKLNINLTNIKKAETYNRMIQRESVALEVWYSKLDTELAVLILSPSPRFGGTAHNSNVLLIEQIFQSIGASTIRMNYSGIGNSTGKVSDESNLRDSSDLIEWIAEDLNPKQIWIAGYGYGALLAIHTAMRVPNISGFIAISPVEESDFTLNFLTPCPNGLIVNGNQDDISNYLDIQTIAKQLASQKGSAVQFQIINGANHHYTNHKNELKSAIFEYLTNLLEINIQHTNQKQLEKENK